MRTARVWFAIAWALAGCDSVECGPGTVESEGECVPEWATVCGDGTRMSGTMCEPALGDLCSPGTVEREGACVPEESLLTCGEGTARIGDECIVNGVGPACGPGTVEEAGECVPMDGLWVHLPFELGADVELGQSNRGYFSHDDDSLFAVDFPTDEGTPVAAARGGVVVQKREDSNTGCGEESCASDANFVIVDHGDGTFGRYWHLQQDGVLVEVGDVVCAGQRIALSGNTGFSTGPHLHFAVTDVYGRSVPARYEELRDISDGLPAFGFALVSANAAPSSCDDPPRLSMCSRSVFSYLGIRIDSELPCSLMQRDAALVIQGQELVGTGLVRIAQRDIALGEWVDTCVTTDASGYFQAIIEYDSATFVRDHGFLVIAAGEDDGGGACSALMGWSHSVRVPLDG